MPIDPNIPLQAKGVQLESPMNQLAMYGEAMKIGEMNRSIEEQNALRGYLQGADLSTPAARQELIKYGKTGLAYGKALNEMDKTGLEAKKLNVDIGAKQMDAFRERMGNLAFNPSNANIQAHLEDAVLKGEITPQEAQQRFAQTASIPMDKRSQYFTEMGVKTEERYKMNNISAAQQQTANVSMRGQDLTDARARENQQRGTVPAGYRMTADGNLEAIPGGPTTTPLASKELQARESKYPAANQAVKTVESKSDKLIKDIQTLKTHPGLESITGAVYGRTPSVTSEGRAAQALYDSIIARGGFAELQAMRAASPTGGALGNVSNQEGQQLKDAFGALNRTQDAKDLRTQLDSVTESVRGAKQRIREAYDMTYDYKNSVPGAASAAPASSGKDDPLGIR